MEKKIIKIWVITLFPDYFKAFTQQGVIAASFRKERQVDLELKTIYLGDCSPKNFKGVDDSPYGGGAGMVMRADVLKKSLELVAEQGGYSDFKQSVSVIYPSARGVLWNYQIASDFAKRNFSDQRKKDLLFICGRYEGIDERFIEKYVDQEISVGDYILTGGELAVLTILDSSLRLVSGILGNQSSLNTESFTSEGLLEYPQYTKPQLFEGVRVPAVLLNGNHAEIEKYRSQEALRVTKEYRPDLLTKGKDVNR